MQNKDYKGTEIKYLQLLVYLHNYLFSKNSEKYKTISDEGEKRKKAKGKRKKKKGNREKETKERKKEMDRE